MQDSDYFYISYVYKAVDYSTYNSHTSKLVFPLILVIAIKEFLVNDQRLIFWVSTLFWLQGPQY